MAASDLSDYFGHGHVFQLAVGEGRAAAFLSRVPILFHGSPTHEKLLTRIEAGGVISAAAAGGREWRRSPREPGRERHRACSSSTPGKDLSVVAAGDRTELHEGQELIGLLG